MKRPLHHKNPANRRPGGGALPSEATLRSSSAVFWIILHPVCCLASLAFGFYCSRLVFFLVFSPSPTPFLHHTTTTTTTVTSTITHTEILSHPFPTPPPPSLAANNKAQQSRVAEGRHGIHIRPWPHPNPTEVMRAHRIIERLQREQRLHYSAARRSRPFIVVTPTYARSFQTLHLTGLLHSLLLVPYPLTWLVVEAAAAASTPHSGDTAAFLARSGLAFLHIPFAELMPDSWPDRHLTETRMRLHALRVVRERRMDGIVVFADESNVHNLDLFDEAQKVKWMGAISVGILAYAREQSEAMEEEEEEEGNSPVAVQMQGPACNSSGDLVGWHTTEPPAMMEWAGFVMNSRLLWKEAEGKPDWIRDLDDVGEAGDEIEGPLDLLKDACRVEPLGECGRKALLWWLRAEARSGSEFPPGWTLNPVLEMSEAAKHTPQLEEMEFSDKSIPSWTKYIAIMKASMIH